MNKEKILLALFSKRGQNWVGDSVCSLAKGNNEVVAEKIRQILGDVNVFKIEPAEPYPDDYYACTDQAKDELRRQARPELKGMVENMEQYDTVILGYPNWWGQLPMPVFTFLESYDFDGKNIVPYCTHEGSGLSVTVRSIIRALPNAVIGQPLVIQGARVGGSDSEIKNWLKVNGLI